MASCGSGGDSNGLLVTRTGRRSDELVLSTTTSPHQYRNVTFAGILPIPDNSPSSDRSCFRDTYAFERVYQRRCRENDISFREFRSGVLVSWTALGLSNTAPVFSAISNRPYPGIGAVCKHHVTSPWNQILDSGTGTPASGTPKISKHGRAQWSYLERFTGDSTVDGVPRALTPTMALSGCSGVERRGRTSQTKLVPIAWGKWPLTVGVHRPYRCEPLAK